MKTLHFYIVRQVLATLLMTVVVFTFIMLLGNVLKEILDLVVSGYVSVGVFAEAIGLLIPWVWAFSLPMGMLTATLLVFGRFSADNELTAVRAGGVSLVSLVSPVLLMSVAMCALSALVNMEIAPRCREAYKDLRFKVGAEITTAQLPAGRYIKDFEGYIFYVGENNKGHLKDVTVMHLPDKTNVTTTLFASRGELRVDETNKQFRLSLFDAQSVVRTGDRVHLGGGDVELEPISMTGRRKNSGKPHIGDMTFSELRAELRDVQRRFGQSTVTNLTAAEAREMMAKIRKTRDDSTSPIRVQIHRQIASSFACFGFTLLGIPLGIRVHRRETNVGFFIALVLVMIYYGLLLVGMGLDTRPEFAPHLIVWLPNFLFQAVGAVLLWRANRGV